MKITSHAKKDFIYDYIAKNITALVLPHVKKIFKTVGGKIKELEISNTNYNEFQLHFIAITDVDGVLKVQLKISLKFTNLDNIYIMQLDKKIINMVCVSTQIGHEMINQRIRDIAVRDFNRTLSDDFRAERFETHYTDLPQYGGYDTQLQRIIKGYNGQFEKDINLYKKILGILVSEGDPEVLAAFPDIAELFVF